MRRHNLRVATSWLSLVLWLAVPAFAGDELIVETYPVRVELADAAFKKVAAIVGASSVDRVGSQLVVTGTSVQHDRVWAVLGALGARPRQYEVTLLSGVSDAEAQRLVGDAGGELFSARSHRSVRREVSVRVSEGMPAVVESGEIVEVIDAAYLGLYGAGYRSREDALVHSYRIRVDERNDGVEVAIAYAGARSSTGEPRDREVSSLETTLQVDLGSWARVAGPQIDPERPGRSYGTRQTAAGSAALVRVDAVGGRPEERERRLPAP